MFILVVIIALFSTFAFSQEEQSTKFGARLNYQVQNSIEEDVDIGFLGFGVGVKAKNHIFGSGYYTPELNFLYRQLMTTNGIAYDENYNKEKVDIDVTEFAVSFIPLAFQFKLNNICYLATGLQFDIPFSTEYHAKGKNVNVSLDMSDTRAYFDFGLFFGFGLFINENTDLDFRFSWTGGALRDGAQPGQGFALFGLGINYFFI